MKHSFENTIECPHTDDALMFMPGLSVLSFFLFLSVEEDTILSKVIGNLVWLALLAVGGICYVIFRNVISVVDGSSVSRLINSLKTDVRKIKEVAEALDIPYAHREDFSRDQFDKLKAALQTLTKIDDYTILYQTAVDELRHLLITEINYSDFDISVTGESGDVKRKAYHYFLLRYERETRSLSVLSDLYSDTTSKFQKEAFSRGIVDT